MAYQQSVQGQCVIARLSRAVYTYELICVYFFLVRRDKGRHRVEHIVIFWHLAWIHSGTKTLFVVASVNPTVGQTMRICGCMIMKHAFRSMKDI